MNSEKLFTIALGLTPPWKVKHIKFETTKKKGVNYISIYRFPKGLNSKMPMATIVQYTTPKRKYGVTLIFFSMNVIFMPKFPASKPMMKMCNKYRFPGLAQTVVLHCCLKPLP